MKHDFFTREYRETHLLNMWDEEAGCYRMMTIKESGENHYEEKRTARQKIEYINKKIQEYDGKEWERARIRMLREDLALWEKYQRDVAAAGPKDYVARDGTPNFVW